LVITVENTAVVAEAITVDKEETKAFVASIEIDDKEVVNNASAITNPEETERADNVPTSIDTDERLDRVAKDAVKVLVDRDEKNPIFA